jgi:hypothetical protein
MGLNGLWLLSLWLAGAALLIMVSLMAARTVAGRRKRQSDAERRRLIPILLARTSSPARSGAPTCPACCRPILPWSSSRWCARDKERLTAVAVDAGVPQRC